MPLHIFRCPKNHETERIMTFAEAEDVQSIFCPVCGKAAPRQIGAPAIIFKGSGFTPKFHKEPTSSIGGVPVKSGDDPKEVARKVINNHGGGEKLFKGLTGKR